MTDTHDKLEATVAGDGPGDSAPRQLGDYELLEVLGQGGMGIVYKARHIRLQRLVALKTVSQAVLSNPVAVERFRREAAATGALAHENLVLAHDAREVAGVHFLVMEFIDGVSASQLLKATGPMPVREAAELMRQAAVGLAFIHDRGLVHRDVKPTNLMVSRDGTVKLLDLGLALFRDGSLEMSDVTSSGMAMGTANYMAPEQAMDAHDVDPRADFYSLGCSLYCLLSGRAPFDSGDRSSVPAMIQAHLSAPPPALETHRSDVPETLASLVHQLLAKSPEDRPATARDVVDRLTPYAAGADLAGLMQQRVVANEPSEIGLQATSTEPCKDAQVETHAVPAVGRREVGERAATRRRYWVVVVSVVAVAVLGIALVNKDRLANLFSRRLSVGPAQGTASGHAGDDGSGAVTPPQTPEPDPTANTGASTASAELVEEFLVLGSRNNELFQSVDNLSPLRTGDFVRFSIRLREPAYVRLLWIDAAGEPLELYPHDPESGDQGDRMVSSVQSPIQLDRGWPLEGSGGVETALLLVSRKPLQHLEQRQFRTGLPASATMNTVHRFSATRAREAAATTQGDGVRSLGTTTRQVDDAVLQLLERMRQHADAVHAVAIPHRGHD